MAHSLRMFITFFRVGVVKRNFTVLALCRRLHAMIPIVIVVYYDMYDQVSDDQVLGIPLDEEGSV